jgi:uncharacterized membrane protein YebE (DUF533 family)
MFNAEKLLGKIVGDVLGGSNAKKSGGLTDSLTSGAGLMTLIGLGVGAVEILKDQQKNKSAGSMPPPPGTGQTSAPPVPPPVPGASSPPVPPPAAAPPVPPPGPGAAGDKKLSDDELARRMIQVMIAAAHADGTMDMQEKQAILSKLESQGLAEEEKQFLLAEMDTPLPMNELVNGITDPGTCRAMYMLAAATVSIDTPEERAWLDALAEQLHISNELKSFIEEQYGQ